jgi:hypothetical protein
VVSSLKVEEVLDVARRFVVVRLNGVSGTITPMSAIYVPGSGIWTVVLAFQYVEGTVWLQVHMTINNSNQEVLSFNVQRAGG